MLPGHLSIYEMGGSKLSGWKLWEKIFIGIVSFTALICVTGIGFCLWFFWFSTPVLYRHADTAIPKLIADAGGPAKLYIECHDLIKKNIVPDPLPSVLARIHPQDVCLEPPIVVIQLFTGFIHTGILVCTDPTNNPPREWGNHWPVRKLQDHIYYYRE